MFANFLTAAGAPIAVRVEDITYVTPDTSTSPGKERTRLSLRNGETVNVQGDQATVIAEIWRVSVMPESKDTGQPTITLPGVVVSPTFPYSPGYPGSPVPFTPPADWISSGSVPIGPSVPSPIQGPTLISLDAPAQVPAWPTQNGGVGAPLGAPVSVEGNQ